MQHSPQGADGPSADGPRAFAERIRAATALPDPTAIVNALIGAAIDTGLCDTAGIIGAFPRQDLRSVLSSDDLAAAADQRQCDVSVGPAFDAVRDRVTVVSTDLGRETRWSRWREANAAASIGAALSVPLNPDRGLGALTFYSTAARTFTDADVADAESVAAQVCLTLRHRVAVDNLIRAVESRTVIGQAQGILMERYRITAADAFTALTRYSQHHNVKVAAVAAQLAETGVLDGFADLPGLPAPRSRRDT